MDKNSSFAKRSYEWWGFTLLPLLLMIPMVLLHYWRFKDLDQILILLLQQLSAYNIVLCSTDLGLKIKTQDKIGPFFPPLIVIIFSTIILTTAYMFNKEIAESYFLIKLIFLFFGILFSYLSVSFYYRNPESFDINPGPIIERKEEQERKAKEVFESPKSSSGPDVKWGEEENE